jgi:phosphodiesterase/alkaline phosphatase D-like protein
MKAKVFSIIFAAILILIACKKEGDIEYKITHWPVVKTMKAANLKGTTARLNGIVNGYGLSTKVTFDYGTTTSYGSTATSDQSPIIEGIITYVNVNIYGLTTGTTYHYRVKAENSLWKNFYGNDVTFTTLSPVVITWEATNLTSATARLNGSVNGLGLSTTVTFEYDTTSSIEDTPTSYSNTVTASQSPVTGDGITNVSAVISGLTPCPIYHFRVKAENPSEVVYGSDQHFYAVPLPTLTTTPVSGITATTAIVGGNITSYVGSAITERGVNCSISSSFSGRYRVLKDDSTGVGRFTCNLSGLQPNTRYYVRSYAKRLLSCMFIGTDNTSYGNIKNFTTSP